MAEIKFKAERNGTESAFIGVGIGFLSLIVGYAIASFFGLYGYQGSVYAMLVGFALYTAAITYYRGKMKEIEDTASVIDEVFGKSGDKK